MTLCHFDCWFIIPLSRCQFSLFTCSFLAATLETWVCLLLKQASELRPSGFTWGQTWPVKQKHEKRERLMLSESCTRPCVFVWLGGRPTQGFHTESPPPGRWASALWITASILGLLSLPANRKPAHCIQRRPAGCTAGGDVSRWIWHSEVLVCLSSLVWWNQRSVSSRRLQLLLWSCSERQTSDWWFRVAATAWLRVSRYASVDHWKLCKLLSSHSEVLAVLLFAFRALVWESLVFLLVRQEIMATKRWKLILNNKCWSRPRR